MPQISSFGALPDPAARIPSTPTKAALAGTTRKIAAAASNAATDEARSSPLGAQLTRFSSVLNSLQTNSATNSAHFDAVSKQVKSGSYHVDSLATSKSIVSDLLADR